ncbi:MAG: DivIVA domain-containing protein [Bacilli bacterium]
MDKEFDVDIKGYSAKQVDIFLDIVYEDYQTFQDVVKIYQEEIKILNDQIDTLQAKVNDLIKNQIISNEVLPTEQINSLDILKRLSKLEQEVYNSKK